MQSFLSGGNNINPKHILVGSLSVFFFAGCYTLWNGIRFRRHPLLQRKYGYNNNNKSGNNTNSNNNNGFCGLVCLSDPVKVAELLDSRKNKEAKKNIGEHKTAAVVPFGLSTKPSHPPRVSEVGGKGYSLIHMTNNSARVPPGFVLTTEFFSPWIEFVLKSEQWKFFSSCNTADENSLKNICTELKEICEKNLQFTEIQKNLIQSHVSLIREANSEIPKFLLAVRSSSPEEDLAGTSFAGGYETILGVKPTIENLEISIKKVFVSCLDHRVVVYKREHHFNIYKPSIAVIVQLQIKAMCAGVGFSLNPISNNYDECVINANWGLGESVVGGDVSPDEFIVDKITKTIIKKTIGTKEKAVWIEEEEDLSESNEKGNTVWKPPLNTDKSSLTDEMVIELTIQTTNLEKLYKLPIDIEFCYDERKVLYIVQARPITTHFKIPAELLSPIRTGTGTIESRKLYWDVSVSVQGIMDPISPLGTSSLQQLFGHAFYEAFGLDFYSFANKNNGKNDEIPVHYGDCDECLYKLPNSPIQISTSGRIYVDMSTLLFLNPKIGEFAANMDFTIGNMLDQAINHPAVNYINNNFDKKKFIYSAILNGGLRTYFRFLYAFYFPERYISYFDWRVGETKKKLKVIVATESKKIPFGILVYKIISNVIHTLYNDLIFAIILRVYSLDKIRQLIPKDKLTEKERETIPRLLNDIQKALPGNVTVEMGIAISEASNLLMTYKMDIESPEILWEKIRRGELPRPFIKYWESILANYGHRGEVELDLGTPRFREKPMFLVEQIWKLSRSQDSEIPSNENLNSSEKPRKPSKPKRDGVDAKVLLQKSEKDRISAKEILEEFSKRDGKQAEFLKYYKILVTVGGRRETPKELLIFGFGLIRHSLLEISTKFVSDGRLQNSDEIWNLSLCDVDVALVNKNLPISDIAKYRIGILRSLAPNLHGNFPTLFDSRGTIFRYKQDQTGLNENQLLGFPVSAGTVVGIAKVLHSPYEKPLLPGEILVAHATNPGWTPLFVDAGGVVLEVGGMLQHGALVAREYGIPCVAGIVGVIEILQDGMEIEVNGTTGLVTILKKP